MNKLVILGILIIILVGGTVFSRRVFLGGETCGPGQGKDVTIEMRTKENKWNFVPGNIEVHKCDHVTLNIYNEDAYDHGFAIDVFGVNKRLPPKTTTTVNFTATKTGKFVFYCSVPCGEGHFNQKGEIVVLDIAE